MKQLNENTWWKYLDGDCNKEERLQLESLLSENPELAEEMLLRTTLHEQMGDLELAQPSVNFSANVMAAIPSQKIVISPIEPLISKKLKRRFLAISSLLLIGLFSAPFFFSGSATVAPEVSKSSPIADALQSVGDWMSALSTIMASYLPAMPNINMPIIPESVMQMSALLLVGFMVLLIFDAAMKKRISF